MLVSEKYNYTTLLSKSFLLDQLLLKIFKILKNSTNKVTWGEIPLNVLKHVLTFYV